MENGCVLVWTTISAEADGQELASILVNERLAACVNLLPEMDSVYMWKNVVHRDRERQVLIKTTESRVAALQARIGELHSYDVPEFIVTPIVGGSEAYLSWIRESVA
jgi:periplasmic divalent cation tolerance protein